MTTYIIKRLLLILPMMLGITVISFLIINLAPGVSGKQGGGEMQSGGRLTKQQLKSLQRTFHVGEPMHLRYLYWLGALQPAYQPEELVLRLEFTVAEDAPPGPRTLDLDLDFQGAIEKIARQEEEARRQKGEKTGQQPETPPWDEQGRFPRASARASISFTVVPREDSPFKPQAPKPIFGTPRLVPGCGPLAWSVAAERPEVTQGQASALLVKINAAEDHFILTDASTAPRLACATTQVPGIRIEPYTPPSAPWRGVLFGDMGRSMTASSISVWQRISDALPITLIMNLIAIFLIYLAAIPLGIHSAVSQDTFMDRSLTLVLFILYSLPSFWVAILLIKAMLHLKNAGYPHLPLQGLVPPEAERLATLPYLWKGTCHLFLPILSECYASLAGISRFMRVGMIDVIRGDFIRTARAKGCPEGTVIFKHALRNSLIPIVTMLAGLLPGLISGSLIIEAIFGIPGMGYLAYTAMLERDYTVLMATMTFGSFLTLAGILCADIAYVLIDPRISFEKKEH